MIVLPITRNLLSRKGEIAGATDKEWDLYQIYVNLLRVNRENRLFVLQNLYTGGSGFKHLFIWRLENSFSRVSERVRYLRAGYLNQV